MSLLFFFYVFFYFTVFTACTFIGQWSLSTKWNHFSHQYLTTNTSAAICFQLLHLVKSCTCCVLQGRHAIFQHTIDVMGRLNNILYCFRLNFNDILYGFILSFISYVFSFSFVMITQYKYVCNGTLKKQKKIIILLFCFLKMLWRLQARSRLNTGKYWR